MNNYSHSDDIKAIRKIMEESSRFLSLSGLSGVFAGIFALAGYIIAELSIRNAGIVSGGKLDRILFFDAVLVLLAALSLSFILSYRKAARAEVKFWNRTTKRLLINLVLPLFAGAVFILIFYLNKDFQYIIPSMLIFYGLALVSAGKFTFGEVQYLGVFELLTGILAFVFPDYSLFAWVFGFSFLHIMYGLIVHKKYR